MTTTPFPARPGHQGEVTMGVVAQDQMSSDNWIHLTRAQFDSRVAVLSVHFTEDQLEHHRRWM